MSVCLSVIGPLTVWLFTWPINKQELNWIIIIIIISGSSSSSSSSNSSSNAGPSGRAV